VLSLIYSRIYLPTYANDLKGVAGCLGFRWSGPEASGLQAISWRYSWEAGGGDALKQQLLTYNREDCQALERVVAVLSGIAGDAWDHPSGTAPRVAAVEDIKQGSRGNFGRKHYFFPELARITKCSYFAYQRQRVQFRTSPLLKGYVRPKAVRQKQAFRPNKVIACSVPERCPWCQSESLKAGRRYARLVLDLKVFRAGVKRWVTRYTARSYKCQACNRPSLPDDYRAIPATKYGKSLCAWAVYTTIALRQTNENVVDNFADLFGIPISPGKVSEFRKRAADYYRPTYLAILEKLRSGPLVHVDETKASLRGRSTSGYVWAFASPDSVVYKYAPTREGEVVREA
jgi:hypothetical protein